jgi:hypothetical protein
MVPAFVLSAAPVVSLTCTANRHSSFFGRLLKRRLKNIKRKNNRGSRFRIAYDSLKMAEKK